MTERATTRPVKFAKPAHWSDEPVPEPKPTENREERSPTRYGDWEKKGIAIDF